MKKNTFSLKIGWLYPDLMSTYGDRGNIIILSGRCRLREIKTIVKKITIQSENEEIDSCDLLFMGGAQDREQEIVKKDLLDKKGESLRKAIENNIPGLYICGAYQFLGKYYKTAEGRFIDGLSIFDLYTVNPGYSQSRLIGNIIIKSEIFKKPTLLVGFENHGGRTYLGENVKPLAKVIVGFGNNAEDQTEGIIYKNSIGSYLHGPILSKNPELADFLIEKAILKKYNKKNVLSKLDDSIEKEAKKVVLDRFGRGLLFD